MGGQTSLPLALRPWDSAPRKLKVEHFQARLVIVGIETDVGRTSTPYRLVKAFMHRSFFWKNLYTNTHFKFWCTCDGKKMEIQVSRLPGGGLRNSAQCVTHSLEGGIHRTSYSPFISTLGFMFVFHMNHRDSFIYAQQQMADFRANKIVGMRPAVLIGDKSCFKLPSKDSVGFAEAEVAAKRMGMRFFEIDISSRDSKGSVSMPFFVLASRATRRQMKGRGQVVKVRSLQHLRSAIELDEAASVAISLKRLGIVPLDTPIEHAHGGLRDLEKCPFWPGSLDKGIPEAVVHPAASVAEVGDYGPVMSVMHYALLCQSCAVVEWALDHGAELSDIPSHPQLRQCLKEALSAHRRNHLIHLLAGIPRARLPVVAARSLVSFYTAPGIRRLSSRRQVAKILVAFARQLHVVCRSRSFNLKQPS